MAELVEAYGDANDKLDACKAALELARESAIVKRKCRMRSTKRTTLPRI
jgi:hypothetical protein